MDADADAKKIASLTGEVDVLFTQFSYANWVSNPEDIEPRRQLAQEKLRRVGLQVEAFSPTCTVLFASFVYFSHDENFFMNDAANNIEDVYDWVLENCPSTVPTVLYPGDVWGVTEPHDSLRSIKCYQKDFQLQEKELRMSISVPIEDLFDFSSEYIQRMKDQNNRLFLLLLANPIIRWIQTIAIYLSDLDAVVVFDYKRGLRQTSHVTHSIPDVIMHSDSLAFLLKYDWGFNTLTVNGRFRADSRGFTKIYKTFDLATQNNCGRYLGFRLLWDIDVLRKIPRVLGLFKNS